MDERFCEDDCGFYYYFSFELSFYNNSFNMLLDPWQKDILYITLMALI
jgi:hypothetical protein